MVVRAGQAARPLRTDRVVPITAEWTRAVRRERMGLLVVQVVRAEEVLVALRRSR